MATAIDTHSRDGLSVSRVFDRAVTTIRHNAAVMLLLALIFGAAPAMLTGYASSQLLDAQQNDVSLLTWSIFAFTLVLTTAVGTLPQAFLTRSVIAESLGRRATFDESLRAGAIVLIPVLALGFVYAVGVAIGLALLVVPGVMLMAAWAIPAVVLVEERVSILQAFRRSQMLTRGARWKIVGLLLVFYAVLILKEVGVETISSEWDSTTLTESYNNPVYLLLTAISEALLAAFWCSVLAALYVELRNWKEGPTTSSLEEIFA